MPKAALRWLTLVLALLACSGCGYVMSGTWEDDPENWERVFRVQKPPDVRVIRSYYWRGAHWSFEESYFFKIEPNARLKAELFKGSRLERASTADFFDRPDWFAPKPMTAYEIWRFADEPWSNFALLIDRETGTLFLSDYQV